MVRRTLLHLLDYLVLLCLVDLPSEAAARQSVVDDEFVGLEAWFLEEFWTCVFWGRRGSIGTRFPVLISVLVHQFAWCHTS